MAFLVKSQITFVIYQLFNGPDINGHDELARWWRTVMEYRNRLYPNRKQLDPEAHGLLRAMNAHDLEVTSKAKLIRKRVMEAASLKNSKMVCYIHRIHTSDTYRM